MFAQGPTLNVASNALAAMHAGGFEPELALGTAPRRPRLIIGQSQADLAEPGYLPFNYSSAGGDAQRKILT